MSESAPLLASSASAVVDAERAITSPLPPTLRQRIARGLESQQAEWAIIDLTALDGVCLLTVLGYDYLKDHSCICDNSCPPEPFFLEVLSHLSAAIIVLFLVEIVLTLYAFGLQHYTTDEHAYSNLFDAVDVLVTAVLEFGLKGRGGQIAGLLMLLRLWHLVRVMSTVSSVSGSLESSAKDQETWKELFERERRDKEVLSAAVGELRRRVVEMGGEVDGTWSR